MHDQPPLPIATSDPAFRLSLFGVLIRVFAVLLGVIWGFLLAQEMATILRDDRAVTYPLAIFSVLVLAAVATYFVRRSYEMAARARRDAALLIDVLETSQAARLLADERGRTVHANRHWVALTGRPQASLNDLLTLFGDGSGQRRVEALLASARAGQEAAADLRRPDAPEALYRVTVQPVHGWPGRLQARLDDVTEARRIADAIREEREKLVDFLENAPVGFFSVDGDGRFLFVNRTLADWLGCSVDDLLLGRFVLHDLLVDPPRKARPCDLLPEGGVTQRGEVAMRGPGLRSFPAVVDQSVLVDADGRPLRTRSVVRNLAPERRMEEALRRQEARFRRFFEDAPIGIALLDRAGRLSESNPATGELLGVESPSGCVFGDLIAEEVRPTIVARLAEVAKGQPLSAPLEVRLKQREGTVQLFARLLEGTTHPTLLLHLIDLTEQKNLERQFVQSQKMQAVGQLAGGIAHDFNNLLTAMIGFCDLLLLRHRPGDPSFSDLMQVRMNANRAANLVRQLLAFSRQQTLQPRILDVTDALAEVSHLLRRLIGENIQLEMVHGRDLGVIKADQGQLEQVLINLAVNARDAMPRGGRLTIRTRNEETTHTIRRGAEEMPPGRWVAIEVADTGIGIPRENLQRIFEPFFSTKEVGQGTGLGLSTVYGIVRQTGGFVTVESAPGQGARFTIFLPRCEDRSPETARDEQTPRPAIDDTGMGTILLVEDEDTVRMFSARALRNKGYTVLEADSGATGLEVFSREKSSIDLVITDVVMPQMDGPTLAQELRRERPDVKLVFISGYTEDRFRQTMDLGDTAVEFLAKPFTLKQLTAKVKDVMRAE